MTSNPLPATPIWFAEVNHEWEAYEQFPGILRATYRRKQLERLKEANRFEFSCRSFNPGVVKLWARIAVID